MKNASNAAGESMIGPGPCGSRGGKAAAGGRGCELLLLPDGRILVHNLTPAFARVLAALNPADRQLGPRAAFGVRASGSGRERPRIRP